MMKTLITGIVALFCVCAMQAGEPFKGTLTFNVTGPDANDIKTLSLAGDGRLLRIDVLMDARNISVIRNPETKMLTMLVPERKAAMNIAESSKMAGIGIGGDENGVPTKTVSTEVVKILGYDTHLETLVFPSGNKVQAWITDELGVFSIPEVFAGAMKEWSNGKSVPLRVVKSKNGAETVRLEATSATSDMPEATLFVVPSDYQTVTMPSR